jgi:hypothetical protein
MKRQIFLDNEAKQRICADFKVSNVTLWSALTYQTDSSRARMLRKVAIERGGVDNSPRNFQTIHNTSDKSMTQIFSDRVKIEVDFESGKVFTVVDDQPLGFCMNPSMKEFYKLQCDAMELAEKLQKEDQ